MRSDRAQGDKVFLSFNKLDIDGVPYTWDDGKQQRVRVCISQIEANWHVLSSNEVRLKVINVNARSIVNNFEE